MGKFILHSDMNHYFAAVETIDHPEYNNIPMAVCGDPATRHGIILAKNQIAQQRGVMTGESVYSAKQKAPGLTLINADYNKYVHYAKLARALYAEYGADVIPYGLDEAWIVLKDDVQSYDKATEIAFEIKQRVKNELQLTASVGVSYNYIFSKLASDMKKPDAVTVLRKDDLKTVIWSIPAFELLFVGPVTRKKLKNMNILTIGDLAQCDPALLKRRFGKSGIALWQFANGDDSSFDPKVPADMPFKSFGNTITLPKDTASEDDLLLMLYILARAVTSRLIKHSLEARCIGINLKYDDFTAMNRQVTLDNYTADENQIFMSAKCLFDKNYAKSSPIRSIGIHLGDLRDNRLSQLPLLSEEESVPPDIKALISDLKERLGGFKLNQSAMTADEDI
ncbi:MAG TPA: DNA polymerase IV [Oscillospiraceae bacterium]|nr:DNA polymerase IV [Oscillospiraceae bacterium]HPF55712.1 DNA polymerase IV [Clostridiales bacterium]HPK35543.1 DNA polymerase IV [Oscillospiraceae bacterium]HPR75905.1 DNA polymerase IV [Oscillospiraceae bacterium]